MFFRGKFQTIAFLGIMLSMMSACVLETPGVKSINRLTASFTHTGREGACVSCHEKDRPAPVAGVLHGNGADCLTCHKAGTSWAGSVTVFNHTPTPTNCSSCHSAARPVGVINNFDHAINGMGDCVSCHLKNVGTSWSGGSFSHNPTPTTCVACHASARPTVVVSGFSHASGGMGDCVSCHRSSIGTSWAGGSFSHSPAPANCTDCHLSKRPTTLINKMLHSVAGTGDCKSCHTANIGVNWTGGVYSHNPAPGTCISCHTAQRPTGLINGFDHAGNGGTGDCVSCHKNPPANPTAVNWAGGTFSHSASLTTCISCHLSRRPTTVVNNFDHSKSGTGDCIGCHAAPPASPLPTLSNWANGTFSHSPTPSTCIDCHLSARPTAVVNQMLHSIAGGTGDCKSCHTVNIGVNWTGGYYSHSPNPNTCIGCHKDRGVRQHGSNVGDCVSCHSKFTSWAR